MEDSNPRGRNSPVDCCGSSAKREAHKRERSEAIVESLYQLQC
jgi:hypothetical protein